MLKLFYKLLCLTPIFFSSLAWAQQVEIQVIDPSLTGVEQVVVYLIPLKQQALAQNSQPLIIRQKDKAFAPYVTVAQKGQQLSFQNQDDITHHIYSVSGKNRFSFKVKAGTEKLSPNLNYAGEVAMGCNIHDWMSGYVLVVDTPYYAQTDNNGIARLELAQNGDYRLVIWHPELTTENYQIDQTITVPNIENNNVWKIKLAEPLQSPPEQENQDEFDFLEGY